MNSSLKNIQHIIKHSFVIMIFVLPASTSYQLHDFGFGSGGVGVGDSSTYSISGISGETSSNSLSGTLYDLGPGLQFTRQANVPAAPTLSNPSSYYNKLEFVLDDGDNPSDALFAIAISDDNFVTTNYVQADNTVGASAVYQTYAAWGGVSGDLIVGLESSTEYKIKVRAIHTKYDESAFSAAATASTVGATLTYDIDVTDSDSETSAPYTLSLGTLVAGSVTTASDRIWIDLDTNSEGGGFVYVYNSNNGLTSLNSGYTIQSTTANLGAAQEGYGLQVNSTTESTGGPLAAESPYDGSADIVGVIDSSTRTIFNSNATSISGGRGSILVKAKASAQTPAAGDYTDAITMIASASF